MCTCIDFTDISTVTKAVLFLYTLSAGAAALAWFWLWAA